MFWALMISRNDWYGFSVEMVRKCWVLVKDFVTLIWAILRRDPNVIVDQKEVATQCMSIMAQLWAQSKIATRLLKVALHKKFMFGEDLIRVKIYDTKTWIAARLLVIVTWRANSWHNFVLFVECGSFVSNVACLIPKCLYGYIHAKRTQ